jgi:hypothetical protein
MAVEIDEPLGVCLRVMRVGVDYLVAVGGEGGRDGEKGDCAEKQRFGLEEGVQG